VTIRDLIINQMTKNPFIAIPKIKMNSAKTSKVVVFPSTYIKSYLC